MNEIHVLLFLPIQNLLQLACLLQSKALGRITYVGIVAKTDWELARACHAKDCIAVLFWKHVDRHLEQFVSKGENEIKTKMIIHIPKE